MITLKYKNETDRAYGLTGMVVCLGLMKQEDYIDRVSLDAEADDGLRFTPDFYYIPNQHLSAKAVWHDHVEHFKLLAEMMVSNILSRAMVQHGVEINRQLSDLILSHLTEEGRAVCDLHDDEISSLYRAVYRYLHQAFGHPAVVSLVHDMVDTLNSERVIDGETAGRLLRALRRSW